jgi:hypothetical protein
MRSLRPDLSRSAIEKKVVNFVIRYVLRKNVEGSDHGLIYDSILPGRTEENYEDPQLVWAFFWEEILSRDLRNKKHMCLLRVDTWGLNCMVTVVPLYPYNMLYSIFRNGIVGWIESSHLNSPVKMQRCPCSYRCTVRVQFNLHSLLTSVLNWGMWYLHAFAANHFNLGTWDCLRTVAIRNIQILAENWATFASPQLAIHWLTYIFRSTEWLLYRECTLYFMKYGRQILSCSVV